MREQIRSAICSNIPEFKPRYLTSLSIVEEEGVSNTRVLRGPKTAEAAAVSPFTTSLRVSWQLVVTAEELSPKYSTSPEVSRVLLCILTLCLLSAVCCLKH